MTRVLTQRELNRALLARQLLLKRSPFLPTWDAVLLVHARRTLAMPETYRSLVFSTKTPHSAGTFLVDGSVAGSWRVERTGDRATLFYTPFERLPSAADRELQDEAAGLVRFMEPTSASDAVERSAAD